MAGPPRDEAYKRIGIEASSSVNTPSHSNIVWLATLVAEIIITVMRKALLKINDFWRYSICIEGIVKV